MTDESGLYNFDNFTIDSATNTSTISETVENIIEIPTLVNEHFWYSKPITMNLSTQQLFVQLSTENNGILVKTFLVLYGLQISIKYLIFIFR